MTEPVVRVSQLRKSFGDNEVLKGIDSRSPEGRWLSSSGDPGSGKSTLLVASTTSRNPLRAPSKSAVWVSQPGPRTHRQREAIRIVRSGPGWYSGISISSPPDRAPKRHEAPVTVKVGPGPCCRDGRGTPAQVGLADKKDEHPIRLSGGQKQRSPSPTPSPWSQR